MIMLDKARPDLLAEWDYERNAIQPSEISYGSARKVFWVCKTCGRRWAETPNSRTSSPDLGCRPCRRIARAARKATEPPTLSCKMARYAASLAGCPVRLRCPDCGYKWDVERLKLRDYVCPACRQRVAESKLGAVGRSVVNV